MKLIKPSFEIYEQGPGLDGIYEAIERAGRTCYKSKRPEGQTAKDFVDRMIASQHYAMLEHGAVYLKIPVDWELYEEPCLPYRDEIDRYLHNKYSKCYTNEDYIYLSTNYRVIIENGWEGLLTYLCEPTEHHEKRVTVRFTTDRGVSHEFVRHRVFSFAQESTRYCNYSKDKFGNEITFIEPSWFSEYDYKGNTYEDIFITGLMQAEATYLDLLKKWEDKIPDARYKTGFRNNPWTPQQARQILPNALKTELVMTGFVSDWQHLFRLRTSFIAETGKPHPDMSNLCDPLYKEFISKGYINNK